MEKYREKLKELAGRANSYWEEMSLNHKVLAGGGVLLVLAAVIFLLLSNSPSSSYEVLYSELDKKDASQIITRLDEGKVPYKLENGGTTIMVPPALKDKTRLTLAGENLPRGETGFELFQESKFGETQSDKKVKYQVALQGELARSIQSLDKVKAAKVNLALPEPALFSDNEESPKASVVINTREDEKLSPKEIQGIINLVANSVDKLTLENVVIVDQHGNLVSDNLPSVDGDISEQVKWQMAIKRQYEKEKQDAIQSMLDKSLGQNNSVVRVNVELDFDNKEQKDELYSHDDAGPFIRSEEIKKESGTDTTQPVVGVPGTDTNIPQYQEAEAGGGVSTYDKSSKIRNYEINKSEKLTRVAQGDVKYDYLTVAVLVNDRATEPLKLGESEEEKIATIRNIVATACGLRENRKDENVRLEDNISIAFVDFYTEPQAEVTSGALDKITKSPVMPWLFAFLIVIIIILLWWLGKQRARRRAEEEAAEEMAAIDELVQEEIKLEDLIDAGLSPEEKERRKIREEIDRIINESPETAAQVLKAWLAQE